MSSPASASSSFGRSCAGSSFFFLFIVGEGSILVPSIRCLGTRPSDVQTGRRKAHVGGVLRSPTPLVESVAEEVDFEGDA